MNSRNYLGFRAKILLRLNKSRENKQSSHEVPKKNGRFKAKESKKYFFMSHGTLTVKCQILPERHKSVVYLFPF